jgi:hypothetical protein
MSEEQGTLNIIVPSDEAGRKAIRDALQEMVDSKLRVAAEASLQKEIADTVKEKYNITPSVFNKWARFAFKQDSDKFLQEADEVVSTYQLLTSKAE